MKTRKLHLADLPVDSRLSVEEITLISGGQSAHLGPYVKNPGTFPRQPTQVDLVGVMGAVAGAVGGALGAAFGPIIRMF